MLRSCRVLLWAHYISRAGILIIDTTRSTEISVNLLDCVGFPSIVGASGESC